jgi:hypothetical protein
VSRALTAKSYCLTKREALVVEVTRDQEQVRA